ncbi:MAG: hypothetical protein ABJC12_14295, partial [Saprospiraceae bacterium]
SLERMEGVNFSGYSTSTEFGEGVHEHTYGSGVDLCNTSVTLQALRVSNNTVACEATKQLKYNPMCKLRGNDEDKEIVTFNTNWRIDCKIWVDGGLGGLFTVGNVGSRTKAMKKGFLGKWFGHKADQVWISLEGFYLAQTSSACNPNCSQVDVPFLEETETNSGNVQRNISDSHKVNYEPNQLWSTHKMKIGGQTFTYSHNGGKLFLN